MLNSQLHSNSTSEVVPSIVKMPFDPLWFLTVVLRNIPYILFVVIVFVAVAVSFGLSLYHPVFSATGQFLRQEPPLPVRVSEGDPFRPRQLAVPTLLALMRNPSLITAVSERAAVPVCFISRDINLSHVRGTDILRVSYRSTASPAAVLRVLSIYGEEVIRMLAEMQGQEALDVDNFVLQQLAKSKLDLLDAQENLAKFGKETGVISGDKELEQQYRSISELDSHIRNFQLELDTCDIRIASLRRQLLIFNPAMEYLASERNRYAELCRKYTTNNPVVLEQALRVAEMERNVKNIDTSVIPVPKATDVGVSASLWHDIFNEQLRKDVVGAQLVKSQKYREDLIARLGNLSDKSLQYGNLRSRVTALVNICNVLNARHREVQLYHSGGISYYRFSAPKLTDVSRLGRSERLMFLGVISGFFGGFLSVLFLAISESLDRTVRTPFDLRRALAVKTVVKFSIPVPVNWAFSLWSKIRSMKPDVMVLGVTSLELGQGKSTLISELIRGVMLRYPSVYAVSNSLPADTTKVSFSTFLGSTVSNVGVTWVELPRDYIWNYDSRLQLYRVLNVLRKHSVILIELPLACDAQSVLLGEMCDGIVWVGKSGTAAIPAYAEALSAYTLCNVKLLAGVIIGVPPLLLNSIFQNKDSKSNTDSTNTVDVIVD